MPRVEEIVVRPSALAFSSEYGYARFSSGMERAMAKKRPARKPVPQRRAEISRTRQAKVRNLLPAQGKSAAEKKAALKLLMFMSGLVGGQQEMKRTIREPTDIRELRSLFLSDAEVTCLDAINAAEHSNYPQDGAALRYHVELAAMFLAALIRYAYNSYEANKAIAPDLLADTTLDLAVARAREIWAGHGG
jgi:hypothetical protein